MDLATWEECESRVERNIGRALRITNDCFGVLQDCDEDEKEKYIATYTVVLDYLFVTDIKLNKMLRDESSEL